MVACQLVAVFVKLLSSHRWDSLNHDFFLSLRSFLALFVDKGYVYEGLPSLSTDNLTHLEEWIGETGGTLVSPSNKESILQADENGQIGYVDKKDLLDSETPSMNHRCLLGKDPTTTY